MARICLVAHGAYGIVAGGESGHVGGVEVQTRLMAHWLRDRGHDVSVLTWRVDDADEQTVEGVRVIPICGQNQGVRGLRFFHPKWTGLNRAMARADADIYYQNNAEVVTGQAALWCRRHRRPFVFSTASDTDCQAQPEHLSARERPFYRYGLRHSSRIVAQTEKQQGMLRRNHEVESIVLAMPCAWPVRERQASDGPPTVLWVGRISPEKRLEWLLDAAEALPNIRFAVAGPAANPDYARPLMARGAALANVELLGRLTTEQLTPHYATAAALVCTSRFEGLPNTFLEAWSFGLPIITTFDPDNVIANRQLGVACDTIDALIAAVAGLADDPAEARDWGLRGQTYYRERHYIDTAMGAFEKMFMDTIANDV